MSPSQLALLRAHLSPVFHGHLIHHVYKHLLLYISSYIFRPHDDGQQLNIGGLNNPSYDQVIIQNTQSNGNTQDTELPEAQYLIPVNIMSKTITSNSQVNDTSGDVHYFINQDYIQIEGMNSLANNEQVGESLYNHCQRN